MVGQLDTKAEFDEFLKKAGDKAVIIDFTATWCGPCKQIGPKFVAFAEQYPNVECAKVDVDENEDVAMEQGISAMPTFHVYKNGEKVDSLTGASPDKLEALFKKYS